MNKNVKKAIIGVAAAAVLGTGVYFGFFRGSPSSDGGIYVQKVSSLTSSSAAVSRFAGVVEAMDSVNVKKDSNREVEEIYVEEGDTVRAGDKLFRYNITASKRNIEMAELDLEEKDNEITALNSEINDLISRRNQASEGDKYSYTAEISSKQAMVRQYQYDKQVKQNELKRYKQEVEQAVVISTISGTIKTVNENGGYDNYGNEKPFITIAQTGELRVKGSLDEMSMGAIYPGNTVIVRSRVNESDTWIGTVSDIGSEPQSDNNNNYGGGGGDSASKYPFYCTLKSSTGLMLGQHVFIEPDYGQTAVQEGLWLDMNFVAYDDQGSPYIWVSDRNKLKKHSVELGEVDEMTWTCQILSGLSEDDYIAYPDDTYTEGQRTSKADVQEG